jgi:preprotein translocase subunit SecF
MFVVHYRKFFFALSGILIILSIVAMMKFGFNFGIDFKGGTITQVSYNQNFASAVPNARPSQTDIRDALNKLNFKNFGDTQIQPTGANGYIIRSREITNEEKDQFLKALSLNGKAPISVENYNSIGPVVGNELKNKAYTAIVLVIICIVLFVTYAFRKVSEPVASWKYGLATIVALLHDIIIPTGLFVAYTHFHGGEIDILFVSAILAILGYSVHDTIVVFDRIREHLRLNKGVKTKETFEETVGKSVSETFGRSINTSLTIFLVLLILYFVGGDTTKNFALVLLFGIIVGTYSSIFVASPLLVTLEKIQARKS